MIIAVQRGRTSAARPRATAPTTTHALNATQALSATHALTTARATSAGCWHATSTTTGCERSGTAATASTYRAAGTTSTTRAGSRASCGRPGRRLIFLWLRVWLRRDQSINGNHRAQINIRGKAHAV